MTDNTPKSPDLITTAIRHGATTGTFTRRQWLTRQSILGGANIWLAIEAVSSTAIEHPEWDMDEEKTWREWEADD